MVLHLLCPVRYTQVCLVRFSARSKSEDDALDSYSSGRRDTLSKKDNTLKKDMNNGSQLSTGNRVLLWYSPSGTVLF